MDARLLVLHYLVYVELDGEDKVGKRESLRLKRALYQNKRLSSVQLAVSPGGSCAEPSLRIASTSEKRACARFGGRRS